MWKFLLCCCRKEVYVCRCMYVCMYNTILILFIVENPQNQIKSSIMISYEIRAIAMLFRLFYVLLMRNLNDSGWVPEHLNKNTHTIIYTRCRKILIENFGKSTYLHIHSRRTYTNAHTHTQTLVNQIIQTGQYGTLCHCWVEREAVNNEAVSGVLMLVLQCYSFEMLSFKNFR